MPGRRLAAGALLVASLCAASDVKADVQIAGLSDLGFGTWTGAGDLTGDIGHCVLNNAPPGKFSIEASGDGSGGAFVLHNGPSSLPIQVSYNDGKGWETFAPGTPLTNMKGQNDAQFTQCMSGTGSQLLVRVLISGTDLALADAGSYNGTIYLNVVPE